MEDMGVVDTKSIESVQSALSLFEEMTDQKKNRLTGSVDVRYFGTVKPSKFK